MDCNSGFGRGPTERGFGVWEVGAWAGAWGLGLGPAGPLPGLPGLESGWFASAMAPGHEVSHSFRKKVWEEFVFEAHRGLAATRFANPSVRKCREGFVSEAC